MSSLLFALFFVWCTWRIWAWIVARRALKVQKKKEQEAERSRQEFWEQQAKQYAEQKQRRRENYQAYLEEQKLKELERKANEAEMMKRAALKEKEEIARKLKERQRRRDLERQVRLELIDSGELFNDKAKRPPIPREVVDAVYRRDGARCVYCGSTENLQLDHIIPFSKGGATSLENLQLLCQKCNLEKSNKIG